MVADKGASATSVANINEAIRKIKMRQLYNGAVTLWDDEGTVHWWSTIYAAHFLLEARKAGYDVDNSLLETMMGYIITRLKTKETIDYYYNRTQKKKIAPKEVAYSLYVLALGNRAQISVMNYYKANQQLLSLDERYLSRDALCSWIMTHIVEDVSGNLAEQMIRWGKVIYLTEAAFPEKDKSILLRYSEEGMKWALDQERDIWDYLVREKLLFKIDERFKINMLNEGPFTVGLPEKGPDRLGQFIGWRMVRKYMEIKRVSVEELINTPYTAILAEYEID